MGEGLRVLRLVVPREPIRAITSVLPDDWFRVVFPFAPSVCFRRQERQRIEVNQPLD
jgi:hypothetical protein